MPTQFPPKGDADRKIGAVTAPLTVTQQDTPSMSVKVRAGSFFNSANEFVEHAGGSSPTIAVPTGNPKWVLVALTNAGTIALVDGTPASVPSLPAVPAGHMPLAAIYVVPSTVAITNANIVDVRPFLRSMDIVPNLPAELAARPTVADVSNMLVDKADVTGTTSADFTLNADQVLAADSNANLFVNRGTLPNVSIRWNETTEVWELTNDGVQYHAIATAAGTYAPVVHTHTSADVTDFASATDARIALATLAQSQVTGLVADLASKTDDADFVAHTSNAAIHFTLPIQQSDVVGLPTALTSKANKAGDIFSGNITVEAVGNQPITLASIDSTSSGIIVDRSSLTQPNASIEWDESTDSWLVGTVGSMSAIVTGTALDAKADKVTQVIAGTGLSGGGALTGNVTIGMPTVTTPVSNSLVKITTDAQGRVTSTSAVLDVDLPAHAHVAADVTDFSAAADARIANAVGVTVQPYDATILVDADIGVNVQPYDATILVDADIGVNVAAFVHTHPSTSITDFDAAVDARVVSGITGKVSKTGDNMSGNLNMSGNRVTGLAAAGAPGEAVRYDEFNGHTHTIADVASLQATLDGKASLIHTHVSTDITNFAAAASAAAPVQSVNGETGIVSLSAADVGASAIGHTHVSTDVTNFAAAASAAAPVQTVAGRTGAVVITSADLADFATAASTAAPVQSVNGETGIVSLSAADVGAATAVHTHTSSDVTDFALAVDARITSATGVTVQPYDANLTAVAGLSTDGFIVNVGTTGAQVRTLEGTASRVTVSNGTGAAGNPVVDVVEAGINHDGLQNFVADEHVAHTGVVLTAGVGLNGGGDISVSRTFDVAALKGSQAFTFGAIADGTVGVSTNTLTVTGAVVGDVVTLGLPSTVPTGFTYQGYVSAADTVTVLAVNNGGGINAGDANATINVIVLQYAAF